MRTDTSPATPSKEYKKAKVWKHLMSGVEKGWQSAEKDGWVPLEEIEVEFGAADEGKAHPSGPPGYAGHAYPHTTRRGWGITPGQDRTISASFSAVKPRNKDAPQFGRVRSSAAHVG